MLAWLRIVAAIKKLKMYALSYEILTAIIHIINILYEDNKLDERHDDVLSPD